MQQDERKEMPKKLKSYTGFTFFIAKKKELSRFVLPNGKDYHFLIGLRPFFSLRPIRPFFASNYDGVKLLVNLV